MEIDEAILKALKMGICNANTFIVTLFFIVLLPSFMMVHVATAFCYII